MPTTPRHAKKPAPPAVRPQNFPVKKAVQAAGRPQVFSSSSTPKPAPPKTVPKPAASNSAGKAPARAADLPPTSTASKLAAASKPQARPVTPAPTKERNWINRTVQNSLAGVGDYTGGLVNSVGNGVNKVGEGIGQSISNTTRGWGQGVAGYGNSIKDSVSVGGPRVATAGNPLGMAGIGAQTKTGGKDEVAVKGTGRGPGANPLGL